MDKSPHASAGSPGYETRDANVSAVYKFLVILAIVIVAAALLCWGMFRYFAKHDEGPPSASPFAESRQLPLGPQLQVEPREDWLKYHQEQEQSLETYAWENRSSGTVRVPVERAMELLLQKGLPVQNPSGSESPTASAPPNQAKKPATQGSQKP